MLYAVSLLFKGIHSKQSFKDESSLWEENIILFDAKDESEAIQKANAYGKKEEVEYEVFDGDTVRWVFMHADRAFAIEESEFGDGTELFSRYLRQSEVQSMLTPFDDSTVEE